MKIYNFDDLDVREKWENDHSVGVQQQKYTDMERSFKTLLEAWDKKLFEENDVSLSRYADMSQQIERLLDYLHENPGSSFFLLPGLQKLYDTKIRNKLYDRILRLYLRACRKAERNPLTYLTAAPELQKPEKESAINQTEFILMVFIAKGCPKDSKLNLKTPGTDNISSEWKQYGERFGFELLANKEDSYNTVWDRCKKQKSFRYGGGEDTSKSLQNALETLRQIGGFTNEIEKAKKYYER